jgi:hypothetical protein
MARHGAPPNPVPIVTLQHTLQRAARLVFRGSMASIRAKGLHLER